MLTLATKFVPHRVAFENALIAGFQAAEFWLDGELLDHATEIAENAREFPFRYALHFPNQGPISESTLKSTVWLYHQLNCTAIVIHQPMFDRYGSSLLKLDADLDLAIENHVYDPDRFEQWAETSPGLTLDVEHLWKFTLADASLDVLLKRVDSFLKDHSPKLQHVHMPGYRPGGEEHCPSHFHEEFATQVMTKLASHGFSKLVVSELDAPFQTIEYLRRDVEMFDRWYSSQESLSS